MISGIGTASGANAANPSNPLASAVATATTNNQFVSENTFLTLLITQLENQNPLSPQDSSQFVSQLAQFSSLEQMTNMNTSMTQVLDNSVTGLIGQNVTVADSSVQSGFITGKVTGIVYYANGPAVQVDGTNFPMSAVQNIGTVTPNAPTQ